jgi:hypothetical protein
MRPQYTHHINQVPAAAQLGSSWAGCHNDLQPTPSFSHKRQVVGLMLHIE